uniref:Uncharacterized protein n=1 Tax=Fibrocapsa japonica TaxID=94617 RepID=A0A7S2V200_9STRA|mmetsp:Transcript_3397/g.5001  ORF Transcript_3397/g.5001 Transcript_3397/m.5001 type:complete len:178 (+) Transcript_3397:126-659(+)
MPNAAAEAKKAEGNNFFKRGDYDNAIKLYSQAIEIDPSNHAYWSNRSASYAGLGQYEQAAEDGMQCIRVNKQFIKGYFRAATAQQNLGQNDAALQTVKAGLAIDSSNADLKRMQKELEEAVRVKKVQVLVKQAQEELECSDFGKCLRTVDQGLRLDAGNADLERIKAQAEPRFERQE